MSRTSFGRREFLLGLAAGSVAAGGVLSALRQRKKAPSGSGDSLAVFHTDRAGRITTPSFIAVDYARCSGCRICEAECSLVRQKSLDYQRSRIRLYRFEPAVDIASICAGCSDAPCVSVCPKEAGALSRDTMTGAILLDEARCIGCKACIQVCEKDRTGILRLNREGTKAVGLCDLCGGDPACVKACPEQCLSIVPANVDGKSLAAKPAALAGRLSRTLYRAGRVGE